MRKLLFMIVALGIISCGEQKEEEVKEIHNGFIVKRKSIDDFLEDVLNKQHPNYKINNLIKIKAEKAIENKIDSLGESGAFTEFSFKILNLKKKENAGHVRIHLYTDQPYNSEQNLLSNTVGFDLLGVISEKEAEMLDTEATYTVKGTYLSKLNKKERDRLFILSYFSEGVEISEDTSSEFTYNLGIFVFAFDSIKVAKEKR